MKGCLTEIRLGNLFLFGQFIELADTNFNKTLKWK